MGPPATDVLVPSATPQAGGMSPSRRATRALLASGTATFIALMSHLLGGGTMPGVLGIVVPLVLATPVCLVLAPVRPTGLRLSISVPVSQLLFHALFSLGSADLAAPAPAGAHQHGGAAALAPAADAAAHAGHSSGSMWLAHAVAAVVTVLALRHGEATLARVVAAVLRAAHRTRRVHAPAVPVLPHTAAAPLRDERAWHPVARVLTAASLVRRGPPPVGLSLSS